MGLAKRERKICIHPLPQNFPEKLTRDRARTHAGGRLLLISFDSRSNQRPEVLKGTVKNASSTAGVFVSLSDFVTGRV